MPFLYFSDYSAWDLGLNNNNNNNNNIIIIIIIIIINRTDGFLSTVEAELCKKLVDVFDERDAEELQKTLKEQTFQFLENEIGKLALKLRVIGEKRPSTRLGAGANDAEEDDDDLR